jgi:hypothetical protein
MSQQSSNHLEANNVPVREHSVETIRRNSEVMGNLRKLMVANRGVKYNFCLKRGYCPN